MEQCYNLTAVWRHHVPHVPYRKGLSWQGWRWKGRCRGFLLSPGQMVPTLRSNRHHMTRVNHEQQKKEHTRVEYNKMKTLVSLSRLLDYFRCKWAQISHTFVLRNGRSLTCLRVKLRTSPTYTMRPWCRTMPTVMESSHTSDATYLSTWMPKSFSTNRPDRRIFVS